MKKIILLFVSLLIGAPAWAGFQDYPIPQSYLYKFSSTSTVTTVKLSSGILHTFTVTGGTSSTINIYDGASIPSAQIAGWSSTNAPQTYLLDVGFSSGCVITTSSALQYTVSYL